MDITQQQYDVMRAMGDTVDAMMAFGPEQRLNYLIIFFESLQDAMDRTEYLALLRKFQTALDKRLQGKYW